MLSWMKQWFARPVKLCKDCRWVDDGAGVLVQHPGLWECLSPENPRVFTFCDILRHGDSKGHCGTHARWWEPKEA